VIRLSVLVLADAWDPHADRVIEFLRDLKIKAYRLDLDVDSLRAVTFSNRTEETIVNLPNGAFSTSEIRSVWARRLNVSMSLQEEHFDTSPSFQIWRNEWNRHLYWIFDTLRHAYWLNSIQKGGIADNKHVQMRIAIECGLNVPSTISSNDRHDLFSFAIANEPVALKFISQKTIEDKGKFLGLYVHRLTASDLLDFGGTNEQPIVLQQYVEKSFEVSHTVVSGEHFSCKIDSQKSARTSIDWRRYDLGNTPHEIIVAPVHIMDSVSSMMKKLEIDYAAFDFVVDREGKWWFLELNSNGQWLWIEELTGLAISKSIAMFLASHTGA